MFGYSRDLLSIVILILLYLSPKAYRYVKHATRLTQALVLMGTILTGLGFNLYPKMTTYDNHEFMAADLGTRDPVSEIYESNDLLKVSNKSPKVSRKVTSLMKKQVAARQKWLCGRCHKLLDETYEIDHIQPLYQGGSNNMDNLMALDPQCHRLKTQADRLL